MTANLTATPEIAPGGVHIGGDENDHLTVELKVSPREIKLMMIALVQSDRYMMDHLAEDVPTSTANLRRWDAILDYVKEKDRLFGV
jgi:hypothetical protein